jgi:anti-sigma28 factor (negative regulator of flagellin synthesis)
VVWSARRETNAIWHGVERSTANLEGSNLKKNTCTLKSVSDDGELERLQRLKENVAFGKYSVASDQVAAKLIDHMLELGCANHGWTQVTSADWSEPVAGP